MGWFNYFGLIIVIIIMVPNIVYAVKHRHNQINAYHNRAVEVSEQAGRYCCIALMIFNIPYTYFNFWFENALVLYLSLNGGLCLLYLIFWAVCHSRDDRLKALSLSIIPSCIFLSSGIILAYIPLIAAAVLFGTTHIFISYKSFEVRNVDKR